MCVCNPRISRTVRPTGFRFGTRIPRRGAECSAGPRPDPMCGFPKPAQNVRNLLMQSWLLTSGCSGGNRRKRWLIVTSLHKRLWHHVHHMTPHSYDRDLHIWAYGHSDITSADWSMYVNLENRSSHRHARSPDMGIKWIPEWGADVWHQSFPQPVLCVQRSPYMGIRG